MPAAAFLPSRLGVFVQNRDEEKCGARRLTL
jgi:hypothetical protein